MNSDGDLIHPLTRIKFDFILVMVLVGPCKKRWKCPCCALVETHLDDDLARRNWENMGSASINDSK